VTASSVRTDVVAPAKATVTASSVRTDVIAPAAAAATKTTLSSAGKRQAFQASGPTSSTAAAAAKKATLSVGNGQAMVAQPEERSHRCRGAQHCRHAQQPQRSHRGAISRTGPDRSLTPNRDHTLTPITR